MKCVMIFVFASIAVCQSNKNWLEKLDELDTTWKWGTWDFEFSGEANLEAFFFGKESPGVTVEEAALRADKYDPTTLADSPEFGGRLKLFLEGFHSDWFAFFAELRGDRAIAHEDGHDVDARLEQYWARVTVPGKAWCNFQAGKFAAPIGNFIPRHDPKRNPLTTFPLPYDFVTTYKEFDDTADKIIARRDKVVNKLWRVPIWQADYAHGLMFFGSVDELSYSVAVMNSAPATWPWDWWYRDGDFGNPTIYTHVQYAPTISTKFGVSWARGAYDKESFSEEPHSTPADFPQDLIGLDFWYSLGHFELYWEGFWTSFRAPQVQEPLELWTYYVEGRYKIMPGLFAALRWGQIFFGTINDSKGVGRKWDYDVNRIEVGGGYSFTRNFMVKATYQFNETLHGRDPNDNLLMLQAILSF